MVFVVFIFICRVGFFGFFIKYWIERILDKEGVGIWKEERKEGGGGEGSRGKEGFWERRIGEKRESKFCGY